MNLKKLLASILATAIVLSTMSFTTFAADIEVNSAEALAQALTNAADGDTIVLTDDIELGEKLTITGNITINGEYTITRADSYPGTLFAVNPNASLTLDGGLTIDGNNEWTFDKEAYNADLEAMTQITSDYANKYLTPAENGPVATAYMMTVNGTLNLNDVTIKNHYGTGSGIVNAVNGSTVNLNGAEITHCASVTGSGLVVNASAGQWTEDHSLITVTMNEGTVIDDNYVGGNHGIFKIYQGTTFNMNGGEIKNTAGWNSNGVAVGVYWATFNMNGGTICSNSSVFGPSNGRNAAVYLHSASQFVMNGGTVCHNEGRARGGIDAPYTDGENSATAFINDGYVLDNISINGNSDKDINGGVGLTISGGIFTQDVSKWVNETNGLTYDAEKEYYYVTDNVAEIDGVAYASIAEAVEAAKDGDTITVVAGSSLDNTVIIDKDITLDLNGNAVYANNVNVEETAFLVSGNVTVKNGTIDTRAVGVYAFIVGSADESGSLIIENGMYYAQTSAVFVTYGNLTVLDGEFQIKPYKEVVGKDEENNDILEDNYNYLLDCNDDNYLSGNAEIEVKGGKFHNFNPADNKAEGIETSFVPENCYVEENLSDTNTVYTVKRHMYTITFETNGGSEIASVTDTEGTVVDLSGYKPTKSGYTFGGWYTDEGLTQSATTVTLDTNKTVYAGWTKKRSSGGASSSRYTVSFDTNGGSSIGSKNVSRNSTVIEPTAPTKDGYIFDGWYTDKELTTVYDFTAKVTKSITLYAKWAETDVTNNRIILTVGDKNANVFGVIKTNDVAPKIVNERTMLPARFVAENLGAAVTWTAAEPDKVLISGNNIEIIIYIGSDTAYVNGKAVKLDSPAFLENNRTFTPIRFVSENLGATVEWLPETQQAVITKK